MTVRLKRRKGLLKFSTSFYLCFRSNVRVKVEGEKDLKKNFELYFNRALQVHNI